jgi:hypothetical protein
MVKQSLKGVEEVLGLLKVQELFSILVSDIDLYRSLHDLRKLATFDINRI